MLPGNSCVVRCREITNENMCCWGKKNYLQCNGGHKKSQCLCFTVVLFVCLLFLLGVVLSFDPIAREKSLSVT